MVWQDQSVLNRLPGHCNDYTIMKIQYSIAIPWSLGKTAAKAAMLALSLFLQFIPIKTATSASKWVEDDFGQRLRLDRPPSRVISLAPSITEAIFALGQEGRLVGVTSFCNHPPAARRVAKVGGILDFNLEKIVALQPQLILALASGSTKRQVALLRKAVAPVVLTYRVESLEDLYQLLFRLGEIFAIKPRARKEVDTIRKVVTKIKRLSRKSAGVATLFLVGCRPNIGVGKQTFIHEWIGIAGGYNVLGAMPGYPVVNPEWLVKYQPRRILISNVNLGSACDTFQSQAKKLIHADVQFVDADLFQRPGPRAATAIRQLYQLLH